MIKIIDGVAVVQDIKNDQQIKFQGFLHCFLNKILLSQQCILQDEMKNGFKNPKNLMWTVVSKR